MFERHARNRQLQFEPASPGTYQLEFSAKGFKTASPAPVAVNVTEISTVNISKTVGTQ
jgi:hypothetical protein